MKKVVYILLMIACFPLLLQAAEYPKFQVGASGGIFRISIDRFNDFYGSRVAFPVGGSIGYALSPSFNIMVKGKYFQKNHSSVDKDTGLPLNRQWQETWIDIGLQQYSYAFGGNARSYLAFGLALFFVDEKKDGNFLSSSGYGGPSVQPRGFYLGVGFERFIKNRLTISFDIELSSAGVGKGSGLESQSVGGIYAGFGFNWLVF